MYDVTADDLEALDFAVAAAVLSCRSKENCHIDERLVYASTVIEKLRRDLPTAKVKRLIKWNDRQ